MDTTALRITTRICVIALVVCVGLYVLSFNFPIFGLNHKAKDNDVSVLSPNSRVKKETILGTNIERQTDDLIYFTTKSVGFDSASIHFEFMTTAQDQELHVGYNKKAKQQYKTKPVNVPFINNIGWRRITTGIPAIYARNHTSYRSEEGFLKNPPSDPVGTYLTNSEKYNLWIDFLPNYTPSKTHTVIDTPLRGSHTFYTYLAYEPFELTITKRDLNWYEGEDPMRVLVYKGAELQTERTLVDDGATDSSGLPGKPQTLDVSYQGGNPEGGIYKIVIVANIDTVITSISTNLHKIAFTPPLFPLSKNWDNDVTHPVPVTLHTDARKISFRTNHSESLQDIAIGKDTIALSNIDEEKIFENDTRYNVITIPKGDVIVNGIGLFSFSKDQYFSPFIFKNLEIKNQSDLEKVDYFVTDYEKPFNAEGNWKIADVEFDLEDAYYNNGKLSWIIKAPGLKANGQELYIRNMEVTFHKDPIIGEGALE